MLQEWYIYNLEPAFVMQVQRFYSNTKHMTRSRVARCHNSYHVINIL